MSADEIKARKAFAEITLPNCHGHRSLDNDPIFNRVIYLGNHCFSPLLKQRYRGCRVVPYARKVGADVRLDMEYNQRTLSTTAAPSPESVAFAFCAFTPGVSSANALLASTWCGGRRPVRRQPAPHPRCASIRSARFVRCELATPPGSDEEETLDEAAMRAAEIHEVLQGLQDFKARIIEDATKLAKKVRAPKKDLEKALESHPDIMKIDGHIAALNEELKTLGDRHGEVL